MTTMKKKAAATYKHKTVRELTSDDVERLAAEADEGYDLSKARPQRVGRPRLDANTPRCGSACARRRSCGRTRASGEAGGPPR